MTLGVLDRELVIFGCIDGLFWGCLKGVRFFVVSFEYGKLEFGGVVGKKARV